jgi:hypothetical protein
MHGFLPSLPLHALRPTLKYTYSFITQRTFAGNCGKVCAEIPDWRITPCRMSTTDVQLTHCYPSYLEPTTSFQTQIYEAPRRGDKSSN